MNIIIVQYEPISYIFWEIYNLENWRQQARHSFYICGNRANGDIGFPWWKFNVALPND